ncbi:hypothetical protein FOZ62_007538 [Perkinsus olseni]|uniref:Thioredoxin domain-containing protein n=1 Tax=Perkinsus olseni TaxID=32597 RepID=A0A7J6PVE4_PEROL|nr:hypothetical protein FOZ62_007538 [Perkinsus olseni]
MAITIIVDFDKGVIERQRRVAAGGSALVGTIYLCKCFRAMKSRLHSALLLVTLFGFLGFLGVTLDHALLSVASPPSSSAAAAAGFRALPHITVFHAKWCGPCLLQADELAKLPPMEYYIDRIDVDENKDLARASGVGKLPSIVVEAPNGRMVKMEGLRSAEDITSTIEKLTTEGAQPMMMS